jgi:hypothetical protein
MLTGNENAQIHSCTKCDFSCSFEKFDSIVNNVYKWQETNERADNLRALNEL